MNIEGKDQQFKRRSKINWKRELWTWTKTIAIVIILVSVVRSYLFTNYIVFGQSMMPTIHDGERIIVNKIGYEIGAPDRFDLVIFQADEDTDYIKRVIGLPGDHIEYIDDVLYVNGEAYKEPFLDENKEEYGSKPFTADFSLESVTDADLVPEGHVFVLGDNRRNSLDSRHIGFVEKQQFVGKVNFSYWPLKDFRIFE